MKPTKSVRWEVERITENGFIGLSIETILHSALGLKRRWKKVYPTDKLRIVRVTTTETREILK